MAKLARDSGRGARANRYRVSFVVFVAATVVAFVVLAVQRRLDDFWWIINGLLQPND